MLLHVHPVFSMAALGFTGVFRSEVQGDGENIRAGLALSWRV